MAKITDVNTIPTTGAEAVFRIKAVLKSAGWTVPRSSDGITYNSSGDQITHAGSGAGGMENNRAWFVIQSPNGEHQWCFQKEVADNAEWRVKVSPLDGFTGGTPNATTVPSATDEQIVHGSGTDASPTMADLFPVDGAYRIHVVAENASVGTAVPIYGFWVLSSLPGTGDIRTFICQEPMTPGSFPELVGTRSSPTSGDPDPCVYLCDFAATGDVLSLSISDAANTWGDIASRFKMWFRMNYGDEAWVPNLAMMYEGDPLNLRRCAPPGTYQIGSNPYNGADDLFPIFTGRPSGLSTQVGSKGACHFLRMKSASGAKGYPDTVNLSSGAMVHAGDLLIPWEDGTAPLA